MDEGDLGVTLSVEVFYVVFGHPGTLFQNDHYQGFVVNIKDEARLESVSMLI